MKIVLVGTAYPLRGGIAHYFALLYKNLSIRHNVEVVTFTRQYPALFFPGKTQEEQLSGGVAIPSERLIDSINPMTWVTAARAIARKKPDLLIFKYWLPFYGPCFGAIASMVRRWTGARCRFAPHPVYEIFGKRLSKSLARKRIECSDKRVLLFFGYIRRYKGLETLLHAMPLILKRLSVTLLVVGEFYEDEHRYRGLLKTLSLEKHVLIRADYVPNDQVGAYFSASDVVVLPYRSATQSGIVQIAYQFDKSVIATDVGGLSEVVIDGVTGFIVPPNDPSALADAVVEFYQKKLEKKFERGVKKEKPRYSWNAMVQTIEEITQGKPGKETRGRQPQPSKS